MYRHQRRTEQRPHTTCSENLEKFVHVVFEICVWPDRHRKTCSAQYFAPLSRMQSNDKHYISWQCICCPIRLFISYKFQCWHCRSSCRIRYRILLLNLSSWQILKLSSLCKFLTLSTVCNNDSNWVALSQKGTTSSCYQIQSSIPLVNLSSLHILKCSGPID